MTEPYHSSSSSLTKFGFKTERLGRRSSGGKRMICSFGDTSCLSLREEKLLTETEPQIKSLENLNDPFQPIIEQSSIIDQSDSSSVTEELKTASDPQIPVFLYRKKTLSDYTIKPIRANLTREQTLGLSSSVIEIDFYTAKQNVKVYKEQAIKLLSKYKEIDSKSYSQFTKKKVYDPNVKNIFDQFYHLNKKYSSYALVCFLNSYEEDGICRIFESFFLEFDSNSNKKIEMLEMKRCFEFLAKEQYVGKEKMKEAFKEIGVTTEDSLTGLTEAKKAQMVFSHETYVKLFEIFMSKPLGTKLRKNSEFIDFHKFAPLVFVFFLEYIVKVFLKKKSACQFYLGLPLRANKRGKLVYDRDGQGKGIFQAFYEVLKGETDIKKPVITYSIVSKALMAFRAAGLNKSFPMESVERILNDVKHLMCVDSVTCQESRKFTMKELLPFIASKIFVELTWNSTEYKKSIEKYDDLVTGIGGTLCEKLSKAKLDQLLKAAFANMPFPNFDQFVKGLDYILHRTIPTWVSPAAIFIADGLVNTPQAVHFQEGSNGNKKILFDIDYIVKNDDLSERLSFYTMNVQLKVVFMRLLYKNHHSSYKRHKNINKQIHIYNDIVSNADLFEDIVPGMFGKFEDMSLNLVRLKDPKSLKKEEKMRNELKKQRFLELLLQRQNKRSEKKVKKKQQKADFGY